MAHSEFINVYEEFDANRPRNYKLISPEFMQIFKYLDPYKRKFVITILLSGVQSLLFLLLPILAGYALDIIPKIITAETALSIPNSQIANDALMALLQIIFLLLIDVITMAIVMFLKSWWNQKIGNCIIYDLRIGMFKAMQAQSYSFYDKQQVGDLVARTTSDVNLLRHILTDELPQFISQLLTFGLALTAMFVISPVLSLFSLLVMPFISYTMYKYRIRMHPLFLSSRKSYGQLTSRVEEDVTGVKVVRAFAQGPSEMKKFEGNNDDYFGKQMRIAKMMSWFDPVVGFTNAAGLIFVIFVGGWLFIHVGFTIGDIFTFILLMSFAQGPLRFIGVFLGNFSQTNAACERITDVLNAKSEVTPPSEPVIKEIIGEVEFRDVSFKYPGTEKFVLKDVTFGVAPGETIAILGATGSGKSTLMNLIPRLYEIPDGCGELMIDGINVKNYDLKSLRSQIGIVSQEIFLFSRSIKQNVAISSQDSEFSNENIINAAKLASIHDFVDSLPEQYETMVGERGVTLSGGQKQRVAIARAIIKTPKILILDDATSSIDVDTEYEIQKNFKSLFQGRGSTTFIISQRMSTVRLADKILVLDDNKVAQLGTHEELLQDRDGIYFKLYSTLSKEGYAQ
ncbi:MAG TPA: ABC transporter ATP-binding protein [Candidatus Lokiarchaeia archaeon]|nr:ABC transporter ATP-binding protein [Candidatus Lokiarchaeia archaeon]